MKKNILLALAVSIVLALGACGRKDEAGAAGPAAAAPAGSAASGAGGPPVSVGTVPAVRKDYLVQLEATGTVTALNSVDVKPQVGSTVTAVHFHEGDFVRAGQLLFTLDARTDETNVAKAQAQLQKDMASLADAQRQLARAKELLAQNFVSQVAVDTNQTLVESQQAAVAADRAAVRAAQVGLSYTRITAPGAGRVGTINVFPGTVVQPSSSALVTITQLDPIAVSFNLPQRHLQDALQSMRSGAASGAVQATLGEGQPPLSGKLSFVDNGVDPASGTVKVKAQFDNHDAKLWPGGFVTVKLAVQTLKDAIVVPQASVIQSPRGRIVYVVENGKAVSRQVELVHSAGTDAVVTGVRAGEHVIVDGRQNVRPGGNVVERAAERPAGQGAAQGRGKPGASAPAGAGSSASGAAT
jgi:RND family efflux transporter MFP subunit